MKSGGPAPGWGGGEPAGAGERGLGLEHAFVVLPSQSRDVTMGSNVLKLCAFHGRIIMFLARGRG